MLKSLLLVAILFPLLPNPVFAQSLSPIDQSFINGEKTLINRNKQVRVRNALLRKLATPAGQAAEIRLGKQFCDRLSTKTLDEVMDEDFEAIENANKGKLFTQRVEKTLVVIRSAIAPPVYCPELSSLPIK
jgi:hypothetical protein